MAGIEDNTVVGFGTKGIVGSGTDRHIGNPPTPTALTLFLNALKCMDSVGFADEMEAPVSIK